MWGRMPVYDYECTATTHKYALFTLIAAWILSCVMFKFCRNSNCQERVNGSDLGLVPVLQHTRQKPDIVKQRSTLKLQPLPLPDWSSSTNTSLPVDVENR